MGLRPARHARAGDGAVHCGHDAARSARAGTASPSGCRGRRPGSPGWPSTGTIRAVGAPANLTLVDPAATWTVEPAAAGQPQPQHPVRRAATARPGRRDVPPGRADGARRKGGQVNGAARRRSWCWRTAGRLSRRGLRQRRRDLRRGGLHHRHDRLPGDADRPVVPPPGRGADRAAHRQHRRQRRGRRVGPDLGGRLRGARSRPAAVELALHRRAGGPAGRGGRRRHQRHRHPGADPAPARARRDAGRRVQCGARSAGAADQRVLAAPGDARGRPVGRGDARPQPYTVAAEGEHRFTVAALDLGIKRNVAAPAGRPRGDHPRPAGRRPHWTICSRSARTRCSSRPARATRPPPTTRSRWPGR